VHKCEKTKCKLNNILGIPIIKNKSIKILEKGKYKFIVTLLTNKTMFKKYVEQFFNVKVIKINTKRKLNIKRGFKKQYKEVEVTLEKSSKIKLFMER